MNTSAISGTVHTPAAQTLTSSELDQARLYLQQTHNYVIGATKGLSEAQWQFKPAPDRWSVAQIVEHMLAVQEFVLGPIRAQLAQAPVCPEDRDCSQVDGIVVHQFSVRLNRFQAPEPTQPTGQCERTVACDRMKKNYGRLTEYLESAPDLRQRVVDSPPLKAITKGAFQSMDGYQWVLATAAHNERHTKQILEVIADPAFPAK